VVRKTPQAEPSVYLNLNGGATSTGTTRSQISTVKRGLGVAVPLERLEAGVHAPLESREVAVIRRLSVATVLRSRPDHHIVEMPR
jgi:hypothetical protein